MEGVDVAAASASAQHVAQLVVVARVTVVVDALAQQLHLPHNNNNNNNHQQQSTTTTINNNHQQQPSTRLHSVSGSGNSHWPSNAI